MQGQLVMWHQARGFGFILPDGTTNASDQLFVHISNISNKSEIVVGKRVEFTIGNPVSVGKKPQAISVKVLEPNTGSDVSSGADALKAVIS